MDQWIKDVIEHHGVPGMKWGVRKARLPASSDYRKTAPLRKRKPHQLTTKQLKTINERQKLEQTFHKSNPNRATKGHNKVKEILGVVGTVAAVYALSQTPLGKAAISNGKKYIDKQKLDMAKKVVRNSGAIEQLTLF